MPTSVIGTKLVPSGFATETIVEQQGELPMVTPLMRRKIRWPTTPSKKSQAFSPGECVVTVTGGPPEAMS